MVGWTTRLGMLLFVVVAMLLASNSLSPSPARAQSEGDSYTLTDWTQRITYTITMPDTPEQSYDSGDEPGAETVTFSTVGNGCEISYEITDSFTYEWQGSGDPVPEEAEFEVWDSHTYGLFAGIQQPGSVSGSGTMSLMLAGASADTSSSSWSVNVPQQGAPVVSGVYGANSGGTPMWTAPFVIFIGQQAQFVKIVLKTMGKTKLTGSPDSGPQAGTKVIVKRQPPVKKKTWNPYNDTLDIINPSGKEKLGETPTELVQVRPITHGAGMEYCMFFSVWKRRQPFYETVTEPWVGSNPPGDGSVHDFGFATPEAKVWYYCTVALALQPPGGSWREIARKRCRIWVQSP